MKRNSNNQRGIALAITLCLVIVGAIGAAAFMYLVRTEIVQVKKQSNSLKAFYAAEAGLEKAIRILKDDLYYTPEDGKPDWADNRLYFGVEEGDFVDLMNLDASYGYPAMLDPANPDYENDFYTIPLMPGDSEPKTEMEFTTPEDEGNGKTTYQIQFSNLPGWSDRIWVKSIGRYYRSGSATADSTRTILSLVGAYDVSPFGYAIFANTGQNGRVINGNVDIRGSVHILGEGLAPDDYAVYFKGGGSIGNNYDGMDDELFQRLPSINKDYYGEELASLETVVAIQHGKLCLDDASAKVGEEDTPGDSVKEMVTGVYITDGYAGSQGENQVYSDNGTKNTYLDGFFNVDFPWLTLHPYGEYDNYLEEYIRVNAFVISEEKYPELPWVDGVLTIDPATRFAPTGNLSPSGMVNSISMSDGGILNIEGMILVDGDVRFEKAGNEKAILYTGKGTLTAAKTSETTGGNVAIACNLVTPELTVTFPEYNFIGVMAQDTITFETADITVMGVFYGENQIKSEKQTTVAGSFISNYFDMGTNVPRIYQVPETTNNLPPGMIGGRRAYGLRKLTWREIGHPKS